MRYSALALLRGALSGHRNWPPAWRSPEPKPQYDVVIVGGGGHGLASAYYLAKNHGITNVAVLERGWLGGGNTGRNTTVVRSNYLYPESARLYDFSLRLYEGLARELNFNVMLSQRGHLMLAHSRHDLESMSRWANTMAMHGIDAQLLTRRAGRRAGAGARPVGRGALPGARRRSCSRAPARHATTRSRGATRAARTTSGSTSSRTAR